MPAAKPLRQMNDDEALLYASRTRKRYKSDKEDSIDRNDRYDDIYQALDPPELDVSESDGTLTDDEGIHSNTYIPIGAAAVDSAVAQLYDMLFSRPDYLRMGYQDWRDHIQVDKISAHMITRHREMKFKPKVRQALQQACCFDYCVTGAKWLLQEGYVNERVSDITYEKVGKLKVPFQRTRVETVWRPDAIDRPDFFLIPYNSSYHDPSAKNGFEDSEAFCDDYWMSIDDLMAQEKTEKRPWGKYKNVRNIEFKATEEGSIFSLTDRDTDLPDETKIRRGRKVRIHRIWTRNHILEWSHGFVLRRRNISGWPLQKWEIYKRNNKFNGMGLLQRMERQQYDINATMNSSRDFENLISNPFGVAHQDIIAAAGGSVSLEPGKLIPGKGDDMSKKLHLYQPSQDLTRGSMDKVNDQLALVYQTTQLTNENSQGAYSTGRRSAAQTRSVASSVLSSALLIGLSIEAEVLEPFYLKQFELEQLNMTEPKRFQYFGQYGNEFLEIQPADYAWHAQPILYPIGAISQANEALETQQFMNMVGIAFQAPQLHNMPEILTEAWRRNSPRDYLNFVKDPTVPQHNVPAQIENVLIATGRYVEVSPMNNHPAHIEGHEAIKRTTDYQLWPASAKAELDQHIADHASGGAQQAIQQPQTAGQTQDGSDPLRGLRLDGAQ